MKYVCYLILFLVVSCGRDLDHHDISSATPSDVRYNYIIKGEVRVVDFNQNIVGLDTDPYEFVNDKDETPVIVDDSLMVTISRSGGCKKHDFILVIDRVFKEKEPVKLQVVIVHKNNGDPCEAYPTDRLSFDLMKIKDMYWEVYLEGDGVVFLSFQSLEGITGDYEGIEYNFK